MIRYADQRDFQWLEKHDVHISRAELDLCLRENRILVLEKNGKQTGWLRFNYFWDSLPFMNMLFLMDDCRRQGYGSELVHFWEKEMQNRNYSRVMTSTQSDEESQFFYRKLGYKDCGALVLPEQPLEIILMKDLMPDSY